MNKPVKTLLYYEWISFIRNKFQLLLIGVTFLFGLYSIYYGKSEINVQRSTIADVRAIERAEFQQYKGAFKAELVSVEDEQNHDIASKPAFAWYRHGYHAVLEPHDYAALAIGQRDLFPYYYRLTAMSLYYQLFENELANPVKLYVGNFDLSFVIIYLFPLLIIAFTYGLYAGEKESGVLPLLHIQTVSVRKIIVIRLGFYFMIITSLAVLISVIGILAVGSVVHGANYLPALAWISGVIFYCAFWFALTFMVISFRKSSSFNAITAAGCWLLFLIVIPAVLNVIVNTRYPLNSTELAGLTRRTGFENENDKQETAEVIMEFLAHNPTLAGSDSLIDNNRMAKAYAAFTSLKDINSKHDVEHYNGQVAKRNEWASGFHWINPAVNMQEALTHVAQTDWETFQRFQASLTHFHKDITTFYFNRLFFDQPIGLQDYANLPAFKMVENVERWRVVWSSLVKILASAGLFFFIGWVNIKRSKTL